MKQHIKTSCGIEKYKELSSRQGLFNRIRFYWFCFFAVIRDFGKKREIGVVWDKINHTEKKFKLKKIEKKISKLKLYHRFSFWIDSRFRFC